MNHGYCKNCWWWRCESNVHPANISKEFKTVWELLNDKPFPRVWGDCHMQLGENVLEHRTMEDSWCPDYINRKKEEKKSGTLEDWIKKQL